MQSFAGSSDVAELSNVTVLSNVADITETLRMLPMLQSFKRIEKEIKIIEKKKHANVVVRFTGSGAWQGVPGKRFERLTNVCALQDLPCNRIECLHPLRLVNNLVPGRVYHEIEQLAPGRAYPALVPNAFTLWG